VAALVKVERSPATLVPLVESSQGTAAVETAWVKKSFGAWPSEDAGAGVMASGSFASFHLYNLLCRLLTAVLVFQKLHHGNDDGHTPLLCIESKLSCVLSCVLDMAGNSDGVETVSRVYKFEVFGLHRSVVLCMW
jgi:hypothetical protein